MWSVEKVGPEGPVEREWFDESGNFHRLYQNGAESVITAELRAYWADAIASKAATSRQHWYHLYCRRCVACGREEVYRERVYGEKPKDWYDAHTAVEYLCGCTL